MSESRLLKLGYLLILEPLPLKHFDDETVNPFNIADGDTDCVYCKFCDDYLPDDGGRLCDHACYCDECGGMVYDTPSGHVSMDSHDATPTRHDMEWLRGEIDDYDFEHSAVMLRVKNGHVETSERHRIPADMAIRAIEFMREHRAGWKGEHRIAPGMNLEDVSAESVKVGCTMIAWSEIDRIADELGGI